MAAFVLGMLVNAAPLPAADDGWETLFNGKDTTGWKLKNPKDVNTYKVVAKVSLDPADPKKLVGEGEGAGPEGFLLRQVLAPKEHGSDIYTEKTFGDCELHVEFMVPKGSNSGIYLMGQYEIQVLDSFGKEKVGTGDVGGIYNTKAPSANPSKPAGEWQAFDIVFRAPRFKDGKKVENARFISVKLNDKLIHEKVEVPNATGGQLPGGEKETGPLMFQGDHGVVAFRNIRVKPVKLD